MIIFFIHKGGETPRLLLNSSTHQHVQTTAVHVPLDFQLVSLLGIYRLVLDHFFQSEDLLVYVLHSELRNLEYICQQKTMKLGQN